jgi:hypothetical protein
MFYWYGNFNDGNGMTTWDYYSDTTYFDTISTTATLVVGDLWVTGIHYDDDGKPWRHMGIISAVNTNGSITVKHYSSSTNGIKTTTFYPNGNSWWNENSNSARVKRVKDN